MDYVPLGISRYLSRGPSSRKTDRLAACVESAKQLVGTRGSDKLTAQQRYNWESWSPLILNINGIKKWPLADRKKIAEIINARGAPDEQRYVNLLNRHTRLRKGIINLAYKLSNEV